MLKRCKTIIYSLIFALFVSGCSQNVDKPVKKLTTNEFIYTVMKDFYLWYDKIPELDPNSYSTPDALLDAIMYKKFDKWSYIVSFTENENFFEEGQYSGYGISFSVKLVSIFIDPGCPPPLNLKYFTSAGFILFNLINCFKLWL